MSTSNPRTLDCRNVAELLPWLVNGSLDEGERRGLEDHLASCETCLHELAETAELWNVVTRHVPSLALAEYAHGLPPSALDRESLERHLAVCPSCRAELEVAMSDRIVDFEAARAARAHRPASRQAVRWRRLAMAASFIGVLVTGAWLGSVFDSDSGGPVPPAFQSRTAATPAEPFERREDRSSQVIFAAGTIFADGFESGAPRDWSSAYDNETPRPNERGTALPGDHPTTEVGGDV